MKTFRLHTIGAMLMLCPGAQAQAIDLPSQVSWTACNTGSAGFDQAAAVKPPRSGHHSFGRWCGLG